MQLFRSFQTVNLPAAGVVATIGNFDGVHKGHQVLLQAVKDKARAENLPTLVILFEPQPEEFFRPNNAPARLTSFKEKWRILEREQIDYVYCLKFNHKLAEMSATDFARDLLFSMLKIKHLFVGKDFRFGRARQGDIAHLQALAQEKNAKVQAFEDILFEQYRISSTQVRAKLKLPALKEVANLLGRPYSMYGRVVYGAQLGRTFGVPTANILIKRKDLPTTGVFCVLVMRSCGTVYQGVANLGKRPTVDGMSCRLEVHLFDFNESLYGEHLEVYFLHYVRHEQKFSSLDALIAQIKQDVEHAREIMPSVIREFPVRVVANDQREKFSV